MVKSTLRQVAVIAALIAMLALNLGLEGDPTDLAGQAGKGMFGRHPNAFAPHPLTFAIWLPIFLGAIGFALFQAHPARRTSPALDRVGTWAALGYLLVGLTAVVNIGASNVVVALALLAMVLALYAARSFGSGPERWLVRAPAGLLAGWLLVATVLNLSQLLGSRGILVDVLPAAGLIIGAALAGIDITRRSSEPAVAAALVWAFGGIIAARPDQGWIWAGAAIGVLLLGIEVRAGQPRAA